jgi:hypothetical protein
MVIYDTWPPVLVENHSLKPFKQRVLGTYILLESTLTLTAEGQILKRLPTKIKSEESRVPMAWRSASNARCRGI